MAIPLLLSEMIDLLQILAYYLLGYLPGVATTGKD